MRMLESDTVGCARIDSNEFCWKLEELLFDGECSTSPSRAGTKTVLYSIRLVIQSYLTSRIYPYHLVGKVDFQGIATNCFRQSMHTAQSFTKRWVEKSLLGWALCYWCSGKRSVQSSSPCTLPKLVKVRFPTGITRQDAPGRRPLRFTASGIQLADSWLKTPCTSVALLDVASLRSDSAISNRVPNTHR